MLRGMTMRQFLEWWAYERMEPFEEERADWRSASIVYAIYNAQPRKRGTPPPISLEGAVLKFGMKPEPPAEVLRAQAVAQVEGTMEFLMMLQGNSAADKG